MSEYKVWYQNAEDGILWVQLGEICKGIRSARKLAYHTFHKLVADGFAELIAVKITTNDGYTIENINNFGEEM